MMNPKLFLTAFQLVFDKKTRNIIIYAALFMLFIVSMPVLFFLVNDPSKLGIPSTNTEGLNINISPIKANTTQQQFFDTIAPAAIELYKKDKIFASITLAQAMLESGTGKSGLTRQANNLFGIKAFNWTGKTIQMPTRENYGGVEVTIMGTFRAYDNWGQSIEDHADFLMQNSTYREHGVFTASSYIEQAQALQSAGYATDPNYAQELVTLIKQYSLDKYDMQAKE